MPSTLSPTSLPSPDLVFQALHNHLKPHPLISYLPSILNLFAHFQLLSSQIRSEAIRAFIAHRKLVKRLDREGYTYKEQVLQGALCEREGSEIEGVMKNRQDAENRMLAFSMEFRKHHIATLLSTPKLPFGQIERIKELYFPNLAEADPEEVEQVVNDHQSLYIRCMTNDHIFTFNHYEKVVNGWLEEARTLNDNDQPPPLYIDFYPNDKDGGQSKQDSLCKNLLKEAEKVLEDIAILQDIFENDNDIETGDIPVLMKSPNDASKVGQTAEQVNLEEESDYGKRLTKAEKGKGEERISDHDGIRGHVKQILRSPKLDTLGHSPAPSSRAHPTSANRTPSDLPKADKFSSNKGLSQSIQAKDIQRPTKRSHEIIDLTLSSHEIKPSQISSKQAYSTATQSRKSDRAAVSDRRQTSPSTFIIPSTTSSPIVKKRPRESFPSTGPDYTTPVKKINGVTKENLRPFENADLHRGKRAKV